MSLGIIFASVRATGDDRMQEIMQERRYWELVLFAALVFVTTMAIGLLWNFG
jgi:type IV secretory pathway TrbF-like protein